MTEDIKAVIARVRDARASSWTGGRSVMLLADWRDNLLAHIDTALEAQERALADRDADLDSLFDALEESDGSEETAFARKWLDTKKSLDASQEREKIWSDAVAGFRVRTEKAERERDEAEAREARLRAVLTKARRMVEYAGDDAMLAIIDAALAGTAPAAAKSLADPWRPIQTAPHNEQVLLYCPERGITNHERIELGYASHGRRVGETSSVSAHSWATHWQPLPHPPIQKDASYE